MIKLLNPLLVRLNLKGKCDDVFKKLPLEERQIIKKYKNQIAGTITILSVTALVLGNTVATDYLNSIDNNIYATPSYTVKVDGRDICNVRNKDVIEPTVAQIQNDLEKEANLDLTFENKFEVVRSKSKQKDITSEENIYSVLKAEVDYSLIGYAIKVNGNTVGVVDSKETANKVLDQVKAYFTQTYDPNSIIELTTAEDVKIEQAKVDFKAIQKAEDVSNYIIKGTDEEQKYTVVEGDTYWSIAGYYNMSLDELISANPSANPDKIQIGDQLNLVVPKPFVNIVVKRKVTQQENMAYDTKYEYVSYMYNDEQVVRTAGKYGVSEIEAIVTEQNGIQIAKETLSEKVISNPTSRVIVTGTQNPPPKKGTGTFINPLPGSMISSRFGSRSGGYHTGQDMAKALGSSIKAADGGVVVFAGRSGSYGLMVEIDHGGGFTTRYAHLAEMYVSVGEKVYQGKVVGIVGMTGVTTGPHLHFEVRKYGNPVNPSAYIGTTYR